MSVGITVFARDEKQNVPLAQLHHDVNGGLVALNLQEIFLLELLDQQSD